MITSDTVDLDCVLAAFASSFLSAGGGGGRSNTSNTDVVVAMAAVASNLARARRSGGAMAAVCSEVGGVQKLVRVLAREVGFGCRSTLVCVGRFGLRRVQRPKLCEGTILPPNSARGAFRGCTRVT